LVPILLVVVAENFFRPLLPLLVFELRELLLFMLRLCQCCSPISRFRDLLKLSKFFLFSYDAVDVELSHDGVVATWLLALARAAGSSGS
jgi:hypothetical protein